MMKSISNFDFETYPIFPAGQKSGISKQETIFQNKVLKKLHRKKQYFSLKICASKSKIGKPGATFISKRLSQSHSHGLYAKRKLTLTV